MGRDLDSACSQPSAAEAAAAVAGVITRFPAALRPAAQRRAADILQRRQHL